MKRLILCDMDGVLANNEQRAHLLPPKDDCNSTDKWEAFNQAYDKDVPIREGFRILKTFVDLNEDAQWCLWSGRSESVAAMSQHWFWMYSNTPGLLTRQRSPYFRPQNDHRSAAICKADLVQNALHDFGLNNVNELVLIDDDLSVLQECKARFPYAICVWMGGSHCKALANGVTTK